MDKFHIHATRGRVLRIVGVARYAIAPASVATERPPAREDQAGKTSTGDGTRDGGAPVDAVPN